jgi:hypothetical protein
MFARSATPRDDRSAPVCVDSQPHRPLCGSKFAICLRVQPKAAFAQWQMALPSASPGGMPVVWRMQCACAALQHPGTTAPRLCVLISAPQAPARVDICHLPTAQSSICTMADGTSKCLSWWYASGLAYAVCVCRLATPRDDRSAPVCVDVSPTGPCAGQHLPFGV